LQKRTDGESAGPRGRASSFADDKEPEVWRHDKFSKAGAASKPFPKPRSESPAAAAPRPPITLGTRILITNLDPEINAEDIREIFGKVGELRTVAIHYDAHNKPKGVAEVVYRHRAAADAAVKEFDGRQVDETRIRVKIIDEGSAAGDAPAAPSVEARRGRGFAESGTHRNMS
jgi:RNA recognition motif-containing protein